VVVTEPVTIAGLQLDVENGESKLKVVSVDFTLNGLGYLAGDTKLKVNDGAVLRTDAGGSLEVHSKLVIEGGTVEVDIDLYGHLNWTGPGSVTGTLVTHPGSRIEVEDPIQDAHLVISQGFDNHGDVVLNDAINQSLTVTTGSLVNDDDGTISTQTVAGPATATPEIRAAVVNRGLLLVDGLDLRISKDGASHSNENGGLIQVFGAELEIDLDNVNDVPSNFTNHGTVAIGGGGSLVLGGPDGMVDVPSNFTNHGTVAVGGGGSVRARGAGGDGFSMEIVNRGAIIVDALADAPGLVDLTAVSFSPMDGSVGGGGRMLVTESEIVGPTHYVNDMNLILADSSIATDVEFTNEASMSLRGVSTVSGQLTSVAGSLLVVEASDDHGPATVLLEAGLQSDGLMTLGSSSTIPQDVHLTIHSGSLLNGATGLLQIMGGAGGDRRISGELLNDGELVTVDSDLIIDGGGLAHVNQGMMTITGGSLDLLLDDVIEVPSNFTNHGTVAVGGGSSFIVRGGADQGQVRSFVNAGLVDIGLASTVSAENVSYHNQASAQVAGTGLLDLSQATVLPFNGQVSPGSSPGILTIDGVLGLGPTADILIEIGGKIPGSSHDRLDVTGPLTADGLLQVDLLGSYHPTGGEQFQILTSAQLHDWFQTVELPELQHMLIWDVLTQAGDVWLEVGCQGTQLAVEIMADKDPVSLGEILTYDVTVTNQSAVTATDIVVTDVLPVSLLFHQGQSSPECVLVGNTVECAVAALLPQSATSLSIVTEPVSTGSIDNSVNVEAWECDVDPSNNSALVSVQAVAAEPCDANYDLVIDSDDLEPAVHHIFGLTAPGNPDCRQGGGIGADDLAAIIEESQ
jgi:uncharacterized repeat protein (TIGR01451 family)